MSTLFCILGSRILLPCTKKKDQTQ
uniref:Uncharacterized protein n=1 Tax=Anguilla anguilla TaxID=7936 RepID=A0A0E9QUZ3_ANGAN